MDDYKTRMNEEVALMHKERLGKYPELLSWRQVKSYDEIFKLEAMLKAEGIPFVYHRQPDMCGFQICYPEDGENRVCSIILHSGSYGRDEGLLEIMGLLKPDEEQCDDVVGYLTADEVFRWIKAHHDGTFEGMCDAESIDVEICDVDLVSVDICDYPAPSATICVTHKDPCTHIYTKFYIFSETNTFINNREVCYSIFEKFMQYHEEEPCIDEIDIKLATDSDYSYDEDFEHCNICGKVFVTVEENYIPKEVKDYMEDMKRRIKNEEIF